VRSRSERERARVRSYKRRGQTDRDKEHFRTRGERPRSAYLLPLAKERRRSTRGRVTPECPRFLLSIPSLLSLARLVPLALTRVPQSSPSPLGRSLSRSSRLFPPCLALGGLLPIPGVHTISLFFSTSSVLPSYKWRAPSLVSCRAPRYPARATNIFLSIGTKKKFSNIVQAMCLFEERSD
jgi:hypothetical protein